MERKQLNQTNIYCIRVKENLDHHIADCFNDMAIVPLDDGKTLLVGPLVDQSSLRGLLNQLWNLNITVISVDKIDERTIHAAWNYQNNQGKT